MYALTTLSVKDQHEAVHALIKQAEAKNPSRSSPPGPGFGQ